MNDFFFIHLKRKYIRINVADIQYVLSVGHYVKIATDQSNYMPHLTLKEVEAHLPSSQFAKINRGTLLAINRILSYDHEQVVTRNCSFSFGENGRRELESRISILLHNDASKERKRKGEPVANGHIGKSST